jgi:hypothetical protein
MRKASAVIVLALVIPATSAARSSAVNACKLVSAKQAALLGVTQPCKGTVRTGSTGALSGGNWGTPAVTPSALALTVTTFSSTDSPIWQLNRKVLNVMPGHPKKISGIGSVAYESGGDGSTVSSIHFVLGKRIVVFSWYSKKPQRSLKTFNAIAKSIAAQL